MKVEDIVYDLIVKEVEKLDLEIYDIEYVKEGSNWYLRIYIDKDGFIDINDCETVSRTIEPIIDKADPIKDAYVLEVSSSGLERTIRKNEHFEKYKGELVKAYLFKQLDGKKEILGILTDFNDEMVIIKENEEEKTILRKDISKIKTVFNFDK